MRTSLLAAAALLSSCSTLSLGASTPPVFSVVPATAMENAGTVTLVVNKSARAKSYSQVRLITHDDTCKEGVDYQPLDVKLTFGNNSLKQTVPLTLIDNNTFGSGCKLTVELAPVRFATIFGSPYPVTVQENDPAPVTPPPPTNPAYPVISPTGLGGEVDIPDNFDVTTTLEPTSETVPASLDPVGAFRFPCIGGHLLKDDPIVYPGQPGKSHLHQFFGNYSTNASSTYESLRKNGGSSCTRNVGVNDPTPQRSAYWMPAMLDGAGNAVKADAMNTYYKAFPSGDEACKAPPDQTHIGFCIPFPNGLRFIIGFNFQTGKGGPTDVNSVDQWVMGFDCYGKGPGTPGDAYTGGTKHTIKEIVDTGQCPVGAWLRVFLVFPDCWNGKDLDTVDHRSHMAFADGFVIHEFKRACPASHPYNIPEIALQVFFTTDENFVAGKWHLSSDEMFPDKVPGSTLHADYWEAWSPVIKRMWQTGCIDGHLSCNVGELGNGQTVKGMQQVGPFPTHQLVPLSSIGGAM